MSDSIVVMLFLPVEIMYIHYCLCRNHIPTIGSVIYVNLASDTSLGLGSELWRSDFLIELRKNVDDIPGSSIVEGSSNSTQYIWLYFKQSYSF